MSRVTLAVREIKMQPSRATLSFSMMDAVVLQAIPGTGKETQEGLYQSGTLQVRPSAMGEQDERVGGEGGE